MARPTLRGWVALVLSLGLAASATTGMAGTVDLVPSSAAGGEEDLAGASKLVPGLVEAGAEIPDPLAGLQWNLEAVNATTQDPWPATIPILAVADSGVDRSHGDLAGQLWEGNQEHGSNHARPIGRFQDLPVGAPTTTQDTQGHGTHVAGVAVATPDNGQGIRGIAPAPLMIVKISGVGAPPSTHALAEGLTWAVDHGARVVSVSMAAPGDDPVLRQAVAHAEGAGAIVVAAAGNTGTDAKRYPAAYPTVVSVGAVDTDLAPAPFSSSGKVDIVAPGVDVLTTHPANTYTHASGTSIATPQVAAAAALALALDPGLGPADARTLMNATARDVHLPGPDPATGHGLLDVGALAWAVAR